MIRLVEQEHTLMAVTPRPIELIEKAGRQCYASLDKIGCTIKEEAKIFSCKPHICGEDCKWHSSNKFVEKLINLGHESVLEHASATVRFVVDRAIANEIVRHRIAAYSQTSTRYVNYKGKVLEIICPESKPILRPLVGLDLAEVPFEEPEKEAMWLKAMLVAANAYQGLINLGDSPQEARDVLPLVTATTIVCTYNFRTWRHVFKMRCDKAAHPRVRSLMQAVLEEFILRFSPVFKDLAYLLPKDKIKDTTTTKDNVIKIAESSNE